MITQEERIIKESQGYDIGFEKDGKKYWINSNTWNEEKEKKLFEETGLRVFRESKGDKNLVFYDPEYFEVQLGTLLCYIGSREKDIPQPINMSSTYCMFSWCSLNSLDLSNWDVSSVKDMRSMFSKCSSLQSLNLANWDASAVREMGYMFYDCSSLQSLNLANWGINGVRSMNFMFYECSSLQSLNLAGWKIGKTVYTKYLFSGCSSLHLKYGPMSNRDLLKKIIADSNKQQRIDKKQQKIDKISLF